MRIKFNKEIEFVLKKLFIPEKFLLKRRIDRSIKGNYEQELQILDKIVKKDLDSIDVGVYRGVYSYSLSNLSKHVHAFEPNPILFPYLKKNLKKLIKNMTLYNLALSDKNGETDLKIPKRFKTLNEDNYEEKYKLGSATIHEKNLLGNDEYITLKVKTAKLDDIIESKGIGFIKIDVEGHEKNVLEGGINLIKKNKPNLLIEIEERHTSDKVENIINFVNSLGYKSYFFQNNQLTKTDRLIDFKSKNNFIFLN